MAPMAPNDIHMSTSEVPPGRRFRAERQPYRARRSPWPELQPQYDKEAEKINTYSQKLEEAFDLLSGNDFSGLPPLNLWKRLRGPLIEVFEHIDSITAENDNAIHSISLREACMNERTEATEINGTLRQPDELIRKVPVFRIGQATHCMSPHFPRDIESFWKLLEKDNYQALHELLIFYNFKGYAQWDQGQDHDDSKDDGLQAHHIHRHPIKAHAALAAELGLDHRELVKSMQKKELAELYPDLSVPTVAKRKISEDSATNQNPIRVKVEVES